MLSKVLCCSCILFSLVATAQNKNGGKKSPFGVKAGINTTFLSSPPSFKENGNTGFFVGGFYAPSYGGRFGFKTEILYSRQGYDYASNRQTGTVKQDYLMLPQLMTVNFTRFVQLQAGAQMAILLRSDVDSSANPSSIPNPNKPADVFSRFHFGYAAGIESNPVGGLVVGIRYNLFLNLLDGSSSPTNAPAYVPELGKRLKHGTFQFHIGFRFP